MFLSSEITVWNKGKSYSMESLWLQLPWITVLSTLLHFLSTLWDTQHVVMKYEMHTFYWANLSLEMWGLWFENKHDSSSAGKCVLLWQPGPSLLAQSAFCIAFSWSYTFPVASSQKKVWKGRWLSATHKKLNDPFVVSWMIPELYALQKPRLEWTCSH